MPSCNLKYYEIKTLISGSDGRFLIFQGKAYKKHISLTVNCEILLESLKYQQFFLTPTQAPRKIIIQRGRR